MKKNEAERLRKEKEKQLKKARYEIEKLKISKVKLE